MFNRFLLIFFICSRGIHVFSQSVNIDSLKNMLPHSQGRQKADLLNAISKIYWTSNPDSATGFANAANTLSKNIGYTRGIGESYRNLGLIEHASEQARKYFFMAVGQFRSIADKRGLADTYNNLGSFYSGWNDTLSLRYYDSSLTLFREIGYLKGEGAVLNYIGIVYQGMGNYQKAIDYTLQGLDIRKKTDDNLGVIYSLINAGNMYLDGGQSESALKLYLESVKFAEDHGIAPVNYSLNQIGKSYLLLKRFDKAEEYLLGRVGIKDRSHLLLGQLYSATNRPDSAKVEFKKSLDYGKRQNEKEIIAASLIGLSRVYTAVKQLKPAKEYARQAYIISDSLKNKRFLGEAANLLEPAYEKSGDYRKSLSLFKQAHTILDSISTENSENFQHKLAFFESKNEIEKEQAHIQILSAEKALQDQKLIDEKHDKEMILAGMAIILLISFITIRNINQKRKKIQSQKDQIDVQKVKVEEAYEELKTTQTQLMHREKMASLGELMAGIAHEIQNPLNFVSNFSEVNGELITEMEQAFDDGNLAEARILSQNVKKNTEKIMHHGKRADSIVKGMLLHSRSSSGQKELTDINALADEFLHLSYEGIRSKDKTFSTIIYTSFDQNLSKINVIPQDMGRVLLNLFNNAFYSVNEKMKTAGPGYEPEVSASTRKLPKSIELRVRDNGLGISQQILDKIYYPFFTTKPTGQGTGLGLSLSYDIITKLHGGLLQVETKEGEYAEFIIQLPV